MSFRTALAADIEKVFCNLEEYGSRHSVRWDGQEFADVQMALIEPEETEWQRERSERTPGIYRVRTIIFCGAASFGGGLPEQGQHVKIFGVGRNIWREYDVAASTVEMGMIRLELEALDE